MSLAADVEARCQRSAAGCRPLLVPGTNPVLVARALEAGVPPASRQSDTTPRVAATKEEISKRPPSGKRTAGPACTLGRRTPAANLEGAERVDGRQLQAEAEVGAFDRWSRWVRLWGW
jgi:hypothetical protein